MLQILFLTLQSLQNCCILTVSPSSFSFLPFLVRLNEVEEELLESHRRPCARPRPRPRLKFTSDVSFSWEILVLESCNLAYRCMGGSRSASR